MVRQPFLRERVYVLGTGERALRLVTGLRERAELGIEVVGWTGDVEGELTRETVASHLIGLAKGKGVHRVIVAMPDRRGTLPVEELLDLRLGGVKVEEATSWLEKISGRIEVEQLYPSWLIFAEGFRFSSVFRLIRRALNFSVAFIGLVLSLPLLPFIVLAVKLDSPGPALYRQKRVGRRGRNFLLLQIPHHASGCRGRYRRDLGYGRRSAHHASRASSCALPGLMRFRSFGAC